METQREIEKEEDQKQDGRTKCSITLEKQRWKIGGKKFETEQNGFE